MADLTPNPSWDPVPQLETTTAALGGPGGPMNLQAQALLNRTAELDERMIAAAADLADGADATKGSFLVAHNPGGSGAVGASVQTKLREKLTVDVDFGADRTGAASCVSAFQNAMARLSALGGGRLRIRKGTYLFNITGDADTIQVPSSVVVECEPGVVFRWGYWGSPLFAIVNKSNVTLKLNGAKFVWSGTFGTTSGTADKFSFGKAIPAYEWCAHIVCMGSDYVEIDNVRCEGLTTANIQNALLSFRGKADNTTSKGNRFTNIYPDDVCQGVVGSEQERFVIDGIYSDRYSNESLGLYGSGHVLYVTAGAVPSKSGVIRNIVDNAGTSLSAVAGSAHSVSLKSLQDCSAEVLSRRPDGALNFQDLERVDIDVDYWSNSTADISGNGPIFAVDPLVANKYVTISARIQEDAVRNNSAISFGAIATGSKNLYCRVDAKITRTADGSQSTPAIAFTGNYGTVNVEHINKGSGAQRAIVTVNKTATDNIIHITSLGAVSNPRVTVTDPTLSVRNTFYAKGDSVIDYDSNEFTPSNGNAVIWEGARQYQSLRSFGSSTDPTGTFQLPMPGAYLVHMTLRSSDSNHARSGLYWVVWDDASANDYTTAQLVGAQISKGGSAPSVLGLAVSNAGVCTMTSTAGSNTWLLAYGYRQLSAD